MKNDSCPHFDLFRLSRKSVKNTLVFLLLLGLLGEYPAAAWAANSDSNDNYSVEDVSSQVSEQTLLNSMDGTMQNEDVSPQDAEAGTLNGDSDSTMPPASPPENEGTTPEDTTTPPADEDTTPGEDATTPPENEGTTPGEDTTTPPEDESGTPDDGTTIPPENEGDKPSDEVPPSEDDGITPDDNNPETDTPDNPTPPPDNTIPPVNEAAPVSDGVAHYDGTKLLPEGIDVTTIQTIIVDSGVTTIAANAFAGCINLTKVEFVGETIETIEANAFTGCTSLTDITLPMSVANVDINAFSGMGNITVHVLCDNAFEDIVGAHSETVRILPEGNVSTIPDRAYQGKNVSGITLPDSVRNIGENAFQGTTGLGNFTLPNLDVIGANAFQESDLSQITINNILSMGKGIFQNCSNLSSVTFTDSFSNNQLPESTFEGCSSLKEIELPDVINNIGTKAFYNCSALVKAWLPANLDVPSSGSGNIGISTGDTIGEYAFKTGNSITLVIPSDTALAAVAYYNIDSNSGGGFLPNPPIFGGMGSATYNPFPDVTLYELGDSITKIPAGLYAGKTYFEKIDLPESVTSIADGAFKGCTGLKSVGLSSGLTNIGNYMFQGCTSLETVNLPSNLEKIGEYAFANTGITSVVLPETVTTVGKGAYQNSPVKTVVIPKATYSVNQTAFENCPIIDLTIHNGPTYNDFTNIYYPELCIQNLAPKAKAAGKDFTLTVGEDVTNVIGVGGIPSGTMGLTTVNILGATSISSNAFANCTDLKTVNISSPNLTTIYQNAFQNCQFTTIDLPDTVTEIWDSAFEGVPLKSVILPPKLESIGMKAFAYTKLKGINIHSNIIRMWKDTFEGCEITEATINSDSALYFFCQDDSIKANLESLQLGSNVKYLPSLSGYTKLKSVDLGSIKSLDIHAFENCISLEKLTLPDTLLRIESEAFKGTRLTELDVPASVMYMDPKALDGCVWDKLTLRSRVALVALTSQVLANPDTGLYLVLGDKVQPGHLTDVPDLRKLKIGAGVEMLTEFDLQGSQKLEQIELPEGLKRIEGRAFANLPALKSLKIPDSVTFIGNNAFEGTPLESITLPSSLTEIGDSAFEGIKTLKNIKIPDSVNWIGMNAFANSGITSIKLPENLTILLEGAFSNTLISEVNIPDSLINIPKNAFLNCKNLNSVTIPENVEKIGEDAFSGAGIQTLFLPRTLTIVGKNAFKDCPISDLTVDSVELFETNDPTFTVFVQSLGGAGKSLNLTLGKEIKYPLSMQNCTGLKKVTLEGAVTLSNSIYSGCTNLEEVALPDTLVDIGDFVFSNCTNLTKIKLPDSLQSIGDRAFNGVKLHEITIPAKMEKIGTSAFQNAGLEKVTFPDTVKEIGLSAFQDNPITSVTIPQNIQHVGSSAFKNCPITDFTIQSEEAYSKYYTALRDIADKAETFSLTLGGDVKIARSMASCIRLKSVTLGDSVTAIDSKAFYNCFGLTKIELPKNLTTIGEGAFWGSRLTEITFPDSVTYIGPSAFLDTKLNNVKLPPNLLSIPSYAFKNAKLTSIEIPESVKSIDSKAFANNRSLEKVVLPSGLDTISADAFQGCSIKDLTVESDNAYTNFSMAISELARNTKGFSLTLGDGVTSLLSLNGCTGLETLNLGKITKINMHALYGCTNLKTVTLPDTLTEIGEGAFEGSGITTIKIPSKVEAIQKDTFQNCSKLTSVTIPANVKSIGANAFANAGLTTLTLPDTLTQVDATAFQNCPIKELTLDNDSIYPGIASAIREMAGDGKDFSLMLGNAVTSLQSMEGCTGLTSLSLGNIQTIQPNALKGCTNLKEITLPENLTDIGAGAFADTNLTTIEIPAKVVAIPNEAFQNCRNLTSITIPPTVKSIGANAFANAGLTALTLPDTLMNVDVTAFQNCPIKELVLDNNVIYPGIASSIRDIAQNTEGFALTLGDNITTLQSLEGCKNLTELTLGTGITEIAPNALKGCTALKEVTLPENLTTIGAGAFASTNLATIDIPSKVELIPEGAFQNCRNLKSFIIPANVKSIGANAFANTGLIALTLPDTLTQVDVTAFQNCPIRELTLDNNVIYPGIASVIRDIAQNTEGFALTLGDNITTLQSLEGCKNLTELTLGTGITEIAPNALKGCTALKEVTLPENLTTIGAGAFASTNLATIDIPSKVEIIPEGAFQNCRNLTSFTIPANVKNIEANAFANAGLTALTLPDTLTQVDATAFQNCPIKELTLDNDSIYPGIASAIREMAGDGKDFSLTLGKAVTSLQSMEGCTGLSSLSLGNIQTIQPNALKGCTNLTTVSLPDTLTEIGANAFQECGITEIVLPESLTSIGEEAFLNTRLTGLQIPSKVSEIKNGTFQNTGLTSLEIPSNVLRIGANAFAGNKIETLILPEELESIELNAFDGCPVTSLTMNSNTAYSGYAPAIREMAKDGNFSLVLGDGVTSLESMEGCKGLVSLSLGKIVEMKENALKDCTSLAEVTLPDTLTTIGKSAFQGCSIPEITLPDSVTSIGDAAFADTSLTSVQIPPQVTAIQPSTFENSALVSVSLPEGLTSVEQRAFADTPLDALELPEAVTSIGDGAFANTKLNSLVLPESISVLGSGVFAGCTGIQELSINSHAAFSALATSKELQAIADGTGKLSLTLGGNTQSIPSGLSGYSGISSLNLANNWSKIDDYFANACYNLTSVTLPSSLRSIGKSAFAGVPVASISLPSTVESIDDGAFQGCRQLSSIELPSGLKHLGNRAFSGSGLRKMNIPGSVSSIGNAAFQNCSNLSDVTFSAGVRSIGENAFADSPLQKAILPSSVEVVGDGAFRNCSGLKEISWENGLQKIGASSFAKAGITEVAIPETVQEIGSHAFQDTELTFIQIPENIPVLGDGIFAGTAPSVTISAGAEYASSVFRGCDVNRLDVAAPVGASLLTWKNTAAHSGIGLSQLEEANLIVDGKVMDIIEPSCYYDVWQKYQKKSPEDLWNTFLQEESGNFAGKSVTTTGFVDFYAYATGMESLFPEDDRKAIATVMDGVLGELETQATNLQIDFSPAEQKNYETVVRDYFPDNILWNEGFDSRIGK